MKQVMKRLLALSLLPLFCTAVTGQQNITSGLSLSYLGQKLPGMTPELFAPDIIATGYYERDITISPDGTEIVFAALKNEEDDTGQECLWLMKADGSNARKLTDSEGDLAPAWSPIGGKIAFSSLGKERKYRQIFIMDADGGNSRQLTTSEFHKNNPCWSPDGKQICYEAYTHDSAFDSSELFVINSNSTDEARFMSPMKTILETWPTESKPHWVKD